MPKQYPLEIRIFAAQRRREGHSWDRVAELLKQKFKLEDTPSRRQMSKWNEDLTPEAVAQLAVSGVRGQVKEGAVTFLDQHQLFLNEVVGASMKGEDFGKMMVRWMLLQMERELGEARVLEGVKQYLAERSPEGSTADAG